MTMPRVLIDGGSGVNIIPISILRKLKINEEKLPESNLVIRAFDGARRKVLGEISLEIGVGPVTFDTTFQILEVAGSFNMLLGRPWIHQARAIPSTIHQMVKFPHKDKLITVKGEHDVPICNEVDLPYIEEPKHGTNTAQAVEIVHMIRVEEDMASPSGPGTVNAVRYMLKYGYQPGLGLGARRQGEPRPIHLLIKGQKDTRGLGYRGAQERDNRASLPFCSEFGFPHITEFFVPANQDTSEPEDLLVNFKDLDINTEAPNSSDANATLEG